MRETVLPSPNFGHAAAIVGAAVAAEAIVGGDLAQARENLVEACPMAVQTTDMPIISSLANTIGLLATALDHPQEAAVLLGAAATIRGATDPTDPEVLKLADGLKVLLGADFDPLYAEGRTLSRTDAVLRIDPSRLPLHSD